MLIFTYVSNTITNIFSFYKVSSLWGLRADYSILFYSRYKQFSLNLFPSSGRKYFFLTLLYDTTDYLHDGLIVVLVKKPTDSTLM